MGANSAIEWTNHTFNPWWGCVKVSPGCEHCYAEAWAKRMGHKVWGPAKTTPRRMMSADYWRQPSKWNRQAEQAGERKRVFCASMADVFEQHPDLETPRRQLFELIEATPWLDWLLLTKRPEQILRSIPRDWRHQPPENVWYGTSVENQEQAERRIPALQAVPAYVRFLSCEPLLGPVDLRLDECWRGDDCYQLSDRLHWVIAGGESGPYARPMHPSWARSLRDQCVEYGVAFHFKQWGEYWPAGTRIVENASMVLMGDEALYRVGKKVAGRELDGRTWDQFPR